MIWDKKRIKDVQVYKEKGDGFIIVFFYKGHNPECYCSLFENAKPFGAFCHSGCSYEWLAKKCYPVSQRQLKNYPEWYEFFNQYFKEAYNEN